MRGESRSTITTNGARSMASVMDHRSRAAAAGIGMIDEQSWFLPAARHRPRPPDLAPVTEVSFPVLAKTAEDR
jgi:hypothetical protein